jgi:hypothetical protein
VEAEALKDVPRLAFTWDTTVKGEKVLADLKALGITWQQAATMDGCMYSTVTWPDGLLMLSGYNGAEAGAELFYFGPPAETTQAVLDAVKKHTVKRRAKKARQIRRVGIIVVDPTGSLGVHWHPIKARERLQDNYEAPVVETVPSIGAFCAGRVPPVQGALVLIDGPPGTGKTSLIRGLIKKYPGNYIIAAGATVANLQNPGFIPFILGLCREFRGGITLILEDADEVVLKRSAHQDLGLLSTLLNATSGILSDVLNLRVVATVNTGQESQIDGAVLRPGRLYRHLHVGPLGQEKAREVVLRETGGNDLAAQRVPAKGLTLAEAYALATEYRRPA